MIKKELPVVLFIFTLILIFLLHFAHKEWSIFPVYYQRIQVSLVLILNCLYAAFLKKGFSEGALLVGGRTVRRKHTPKAFWFALIVQILFLFGAVGVCLYLIS